MLSELVDIFVDADTADRSSQSDDKSVDVEYRDIGGPQDCSAGTFWNADTKKCEDCPAGTYRYFSFKFSLTLVKTIRVH